MSLDSRHGTIVDSRFSKAKDAIISFLLSIKEHRKVPVSKVASLVGQLIPMSIVLGHISQIMTRFLSLDILQSWSWESYIQLNDDISQQFAFWVDNLPVLNTKDIYKSHSSLV